MQKPATKTEANTEAKTESKPLFTLTDEAPKGRTRNTNSIYREIVASFIESNLEHAKVAVEGKTASQVYNGLRTALRNGKGFADRAKAIRRVDGETMTVYLIRVAAEPTE